MNDRYDLNFRRILVTFFITIFFVLGFGKGPGTFSSFRLGIRDAFCNISQTKSFVINAALASDDFLLWRTPYTITIDNIHGVLLSGTNVVGGLDECDSNGANAVAIDSDITFNGSLDSDDGSLTNEEVDSGDWIKWHTTSVDAPGYLTVTVYYHYSITTFLSEIVGL